jgi:hypothetical protein
VWWDEIAAGLSKPLKFPAKENEQKCIIRSLYTETQAETAKLMVHKTIQGPKHISKVKKYSIMAWMNLGDSSNGCPWNKKHVKGEVKVCKSILFFPILLCRH